MGTRSLGKRISDAAEDEAYRPLVPVGPGRGQHQDPGLYGPDSEAWRLNREAMLLLGAGPRALLLQLAHPAVEP